MGSNPTRPAHTSNDSWCNSNTPDSESGIRGANPCGSISSRFGVVVARFSEKEEVLERYQEVALARGSIVQPGKIPVLQSGDAGSNPAGSTHAHAEQVWDKVLKRL